MLEFGSVKAAEDEQELSVIEDAQNETETLGGTTNQQDVLKSKIKGVDENLVKMLERIEIEMRHKIDEYKEMLDVFKDDKKFEKKHQARLRYLEVKRKDERQQAAREREEKLIEERKLRNIEKMKKKENVQADTNKRLMYRSPQPPMRVFKKKVEQTKDEADFLKYLGAEFDMQEDLISDAKSKLASQSSLRS